MRTIQTILNDPRITVTYRNSQNDKITQLKFGVKAKYNGKVALVKFSRVLGWEHLSVSFDDETPSWDFMQEMKEMFWEDEEEAFQLHPAKSNYINNHEHCLHVWRPLNQEIPLPPTITVGFIEGKDIEKQMDDLINLQNEIGSPLSEGQIKLIRAQLKGPEELKKVMKEISIEDMIRMVF
jgi:hypothetical protein